MMQLATGSVVVVRTRSALKAEERAEERAEEAEESLSPAYSASCSEPSSTTQRKLVGGDSRVPFGRSRWAWTGVALAAAAKLPRVSRVLSDDLVA